MLSSAVVFDYSNLCQRCLHLQQIGADGPRPAWDLMRYMIFEKMMDFISSHAPAGADVILAMDSPGDYWRRDIYPPYKADRSARREASGIDYKTAFRHFQALAADIETYLPWKTVSVPKCEADDVIYMTTLLYPEGVIINSADSDYIQLCQGRVRLYRAHEEDWFSFPYKGMNDADTFLKAAIITGQSGKDNVYNVRTPTSWKPEDGRKPGCGMKMATRLMEGDLMRNLEERDLLENYQRNRTLIDMSCLPEQYRTAIETALKAKDITTCDIAGFFSRYGWPSYSSSSFRTENAIETISCVAGIACPSGPVEAPEDLEIDEVDFSFV